MPTKQMHGSDPHALRLRRMTLSIEAINARIVRLAIALDVSLQSDGEIVQAINRPRPPAASRSRQVTSEVLMARKFEELRGLLVLRYGVEARYVNQVGASAARQILIDAEEHLVRKGFTAGDDGIDLNRLVEAL